MNKNCKCTYPGCSRHGICRECVEYHRVNEELPACYFSPEVEKTFDRSINKYIESRRNG